MLKPNRMIFFFAQQLLIPSLVQIKNEKAQYEWWVEEENGLYLTL